MEIEQCRMDLESAARALGVHYQTAYRWVRTGLLPAVKADQGYRLDPRDVEALAAARRAPRPLSYTGRRRDWDRLREQLYEALLAGDETAARRRLAIGIAERVLALAIGWVPAGSRGLALVAPSEGDRHRLGGLMIAA